MVDFGKMLAWSRIAKLAGLLGSEHDGERLNAARILSRELGKANLTFGDLSERLKHGGGGERVRIEYVDRVRVERAEPNPAANIASKIIAVAMRRLTRMERGFLEGIITRNSMTSGYFNLSDSQALWLARIHQTHCGPPVPKPAPRKPVPQAILDELGLDRPGRYKGPQAGPRDAMPDASREAQGPQLTPEQRAEILDGLGLGPDVGKFKGEDHVGKRFSGLDLDDDDSF